MIAPRLRVLDRVAQRLARDAERFLADDGIQVARLAVDRDVNRRRGTGRPHRWSACSADRGDAVRQIVHRRRRRAQALHGVAAFGDRLRRVINRAIQFLFRASAGRSGSRYDAVWNRSSNPWKLCSSVSCSSRAMRVRSLTRSSSRR